uniref:Uncharacterized protein n=1 Tax=Monodon monoceros TaxID=40151 RepID=A0A8C6F2H1_MONMO
MQTKIRGVRIKERRTEKQKVSEAQEDANPDCLSLKDQLPLTGEGDRTVIVHFIFTESRTEESIPHSKNERENSKAPKI